MTFLVSFKLETIKKKTSLLTDFNVPDIEKQIFCTVGHISSKILYNILKDYTATCSQELRQSWEKELGTHITENM